MSVAFPTPAPTGRPTSGRSFVAAGIVLGVVAFGLAGGLAAYGVLASNRIATGTPIVVAAKAIPLRHQITINDLKLDSYSPAPPGAFTDKAKVVGNVAEVAIPAGSPITSNLVAAADAGLTTTSALAYLPIPSGWVAETIPTSEITGVGGYIQAGDYIEVLATISTGTFGVNPSGPVVRTVFRNLYVIKIGPTGSATPTQSTAPTTSLTVIMTACDAEFMDWFLTVAQLKYVLESAKDYQSPATQPDPSCPQITSSKGVSTKEVDARWHFTTNP
jgi:pilus assembly protein CpaB